MADYDVIVAGGGLAGTITAQSISFYSNQNLKILVVDRNPDSLPGRKSLAGWVCGDACSKEAVDFMTDRIKVEWTKPEIEHDVKGVMAFSPDRETAIPFDGGVELSGVEWGGETDDDDRNLAGEAAKNGA